jgi:hypothetical protein
MIRLYPCVELAPEGELGADWPTMPDATFMHVRLTDEVSPLAVGSIMSTFARYNTDHGMHAPKATPALLLAALERPAPILPGGVIAVDEASGAEIPPGCCSGLEHWRDWVDFLEGGDSPWLGHDPTPYLVREDDAVAVCAMMGEPLALVRLTLPRADYVQQLAAVERHLNDFTAAVRDWSRVYLPDHATTLVTRIATAFGGAPQSS